jgi:Family of unknown function (DUF5677)
MSQSMMRQEATFDVQAAIALGRARAARLLETVGPHFPRDVPSDGRHDNWGVTGPAFVARATLLVRAILHLPNELEAEAGMLVRILYEYVTLFAWLAADPLDNLAQWVRGDRAERLRTDNDLRQQFGRGLDDVTRARFEAERDAVPHQWPGLPGLAHQADEFWSQRLRAFENAALEAMYPAIYRQFSPLVHAMPDALQRIVGDGPAPGISRVGMIEAPSGFNPFTNTPFIFALGLLVSSEALGFPEQRAIEQVFEGNRVPA